MPRRLTEAQAIKLYAEIEASIDRSKERAAEMIRRGQQDARDGFPSSSGGGSGGGSDVSKPTEAEALAPAMPDPTGAIIKRWEEELVEVALHSNNVDNLSKQVLSLEADARGRQSSIPNCVNPACGVSLATHGPTGRGTSGRCDACYEYRRTHDLNDRPKHLVEAHLRRQTNS